MVRFSRHVKNILKGIKHFQARLNSQKITHIVYQMPFSFLILSFHLSSILFFSFIDSKQPPPFHCFSYFITLPSFPLNTIPFLQLYFSPSHACLISLHTSLFPVPSSVFFAFFLELLHWREMDRLGPQREQSKLSPDKASEKTLTTSHTHRFQRDSETRHTQTHEHYTSFIYSWSKSNVPVSLISRSRTFRKHSKNHAYRHTLLLT